MSGGVVRGEERFFLRCLLATVSLLCLHAWSCMLSILDISQKSFGAGQPMLLSISPADMLLSISHADMLLSISHADNASEHISC